MSCPKKWFIECIDAWFSVEQYLYFSKCIFYMLHILFLTKVLNTSLTPYGLLAALHFIFLNKHAFLFDFFFPTTMKICLNIAATLHQYNQLSVTALFTCLNTACFIFVEKLWHHLWLLGMLQHDQAHTVLSAVSSFLNPVWFVQMRTNSNNNSVIESEKIFLN